MAGKKTNDPELDKAMIGITFRVPVINAVRYVELLTRLWQKGTTVDLAFSYVEPAEQRKHGLAEQASKNGSGGPANGLEPIPIGRKPNKKREPAKT